MRPNSGLMWTPSVDSSLLRYQAQIERTLHEFQLNRRVEETVRTCLGRLKDAPLEALETVRKALHEIPSDDRLLTLEARIQDHIERLSADEARSAILMQANQSLRQRKYASAVSVLQQAQPALLTPEMTQLLDFAREQARQEEVQQLLARTNVEAQALLQNEKLRECIALLGPVVQSTGDPRLSGMLERAQRLLDESTAEQTAAWSLLKPFADSGCYEQVLALIPTVPPRAAASAEIVQLQQTAQDAWNQEIRELELLGRAYATRPARDGGVDYALPHPLYSELLRQATERYTARRQ